MLTIAVPDVGLIWFLTCRTSCRDGEEKRGCSLVAVEREGTTNVRHDIRAILKSNVIVKRMMRRDFAEEIFNGDARRSRSFHFFRIYLGQPPMHGNVKINIDRSGRLRKSCLESPGSRLWYFYRKLNPIGDLRTKISFSREQACARRCTCSTNRKEIR